MTKRKTTKEKNEELAKQGKQLNYFGIVLRIYPNEAQEDLIKQTFGCSRLIYNRHLDKDTVALHKQNMVFT